MKLTYEQRIFAHLMSNPGASTSEIANALGVSLSYAMTVAKRMQKKGLITSKLRQHSGKTMRHFYALQEDGVQAVLTQARRIGHPFGIAAAQVMA